MARAVGVQLLCMAPVIVACSASTVGNRAPTAATVTKPRANVGPALTAAEMQLVITGAARLNRHCSRNAAPSGLYMLRVIVSPTGRVQSATPRAAPSRAIAPGRYLGAPAHIDAGSQPRNLVTQCYARAFADLRFRAFSGPPVGFDHPVVVDHPASQ